MWTSFLREQVRSAWEEADRERSSARVAMLLDRKGNVRHSGAPTIVRLQCYGVGTGRAFSERAADQARSLIDLESLGKLSLYAVTRRRIGCGYLIGIRLTRNSF